MNGILTYRCRDVLFSPKKLGLQDKGFNRNLGISLLWQGIPALQRAAAVPTSCPQSISRERDALELRFGAELRLTCQGKIGSQGTEKGFATKMLDKIELCGEHEMRNETIRRLTSLLLAPLLQRGPGVLAESLTSHSDAWSCKRLSSTYVSLGLKNNPFATQSYLDILQPLAKYDARMGDLIGNNDGSTNSPCRLQTSGNNSFTGFHGSLFSAGSIQHNDKPCLFCSSKAEFLCVALVLRTYHTALSMWPML